MLFFFFEHLKTSTVARCAPALTEVLLPVLWFSLGLVNWLETGPGASERAAVFAARSRCSSSAPFRLMQARTSRWNKLRTSSRWWRVYRLQVDQTMWHGSLREPVYEFLHRSQKNAARGWGEGNSNSSDTRRRARAETEETEAQTWKLWPATSVTNCDFTWRWSVNVWWWPSQAAWNRRLFSWKTQRLKHGGRNKTYNQTDRMHVSLFGSCHEGIRSLDFVTELFPGTRLWCCCVFIWSSSNLQLHSPKHTFKIFYRKSSSLKQTSEAEKEQQTAFCDCFLSSVSKKD